MRRVISSAWTVPFKVVVPLALVAISIFLILSLSMYASRPPTGAMIGAFITILATAFFCWWGAKLKRVSVDDQSLYFSNFVREISIALVDVISVDDFQGGVPVRVRLKTNSEFGQTILFMAKLEGSPFHKVHPIVGELRARVKAATES